MIYFDENKNAYAFKIPNYIAKINETTWELYASTDKWDIINGQFVDISQTDEYKEKHKKEEEEKFNQEFFETSLGYVRRKVNMQTGETKSFLFDILPILEVGTTIITYKKDGTQNSNVYVTEEFIQECKRQVIVDFYGN